MITYVLREIICTLTLFWLNTAWKESKYGVFSGPCSPAFRLNTEIYGVGLGIQSKCGKTQTRKNSLFGHFSRSEKEYSSVLLAPSFSKINCKSLMVIKVIERIMKFAIIKPFKIISWPKNFTSIETKTKV